jgi:hypothetical protein
MYGMLLMLSLHAGITLEFKSDTFVLAAGQQGTISIKISKSRTRPVAAVAHKKIRQKQKAKGYDNSVLLLHVSTFTFGFTTVFTTPHLTVQNSSGYTWRCLASP